MDNELVTQVGSRIACCLTDSVVQPSQTSKIFEGIGRSETGSNSSSEGCLHFGIGATLADFHFVGPVHLGMEMANRCVRGDAVTSELNRRRREFSIAASSGFPGTQTSQLLGNA